MKTKFHIIGPYSLIQYSEYDRLEYLNETKEAFLQKLKFLEKFTNIVVLNCTKEMLLFLNNLDWNSEVVVFIEYSEYQKLKFLLNIAINQDAKIVEPIEKPIFKNSDSKIFNWYFSNLKKGLIYTSCYKLYNRLRYSDLPYITYI